VRTLQSIRFQPLGPSRHRGSPSSHGISCSFRVSTRLVSRLLVPRSHFAVSHFLDLVVFRCRVPPESSFKFSNEPLLEFRLPPEYFPVVPSQRTLREGVTSNSPGLAFPSAHAGHRGPLFAGLPRPLSSTFRVWLPSWWFSPPTPAPALFHAGSAHGILPFGAFPSRKASPHFPAETDLHAVPPVVAPSGDPSGRTNGPRLPGLQPSESPSSRAMQLTSHRERMLPWAFPLSGQPTGYLALSGSSLALRTSTAFALAPAAPQSINQQPAGSLSFRKGKLFKPRPSNPPKVSAPLSTCRFDRGQLGLWVHLAAHPPLLEDKCCS
jgi:hypothetical protein